jgi:antitoxin (DNA-binding transcriptional repressor) of toxin-antitoxin stability system
MGTGLPGETTRVSKPMHATARRITWCLIVGALASVAGTATATPYTRAPHASGASIAPTKHPLPEILIDVESGAEDIVDLALSGDRGTAVSTAADLKSSAYGPATAALVAAGVPAADVSELRRRTSSVLRTAQKGSFVQIALAANAVSQLMPDLYARFQNRVPTLILALDYFDREAQLRSLARDPGKVVVAIAGLERTWPRVRPKVRAAGGAKEAAAFDRHVLAMTRLRAGTPRKVQAEAVRGLELVDELERVFTG